MRPGGHAGLQCPDPDPPRGALEPPYELFRHVRRFTAPRGEPRLALAVLEDAVRCLAGARASRNFDVRLSGWEAGQWIASRDRGPLFSFENICLILGLDRSEVRESIRRWFARLSAPAGGKEG